MTRRRSYLLRERWLCPIQIRKWWLCFPGPPTGSGSCGILHRVLNPQGWTIGFSGWHELVLSHPPRFLSSRRCMKSSLVCGRHLLLPETAPVGPPPSPPLMAVRLRVTRASPLWSGPWLCSCALTPPGAGSRLSLPGPVSTHRTGRAYQACGEAASALYAMALLQVHQAKALRDLHEGGHDPQVGPQEMGVATRHVPSGNHSGMPPNLQPVVRPLVSSGRSSPRAGVPACCSLHGCLCHRLGGHLQRAGSVRGVDGPPTALAHQLPRVASSIPCPGPPEGAVTGQACAGPYGQYCDRCVHQLSRRSALPSHVATRPPSPPLESEASEVASRHSCPWCAQPCGRRALMSCAARRVATPPPGGPADLGGVRRGSGRPDCLARNLPLPVVLLPVRGDTRYRCTGAQLALGPSQVCVSPSEPTCTGLVQSQGGRGAGLASCALLAQPDLVPGTHAPC